MDILQLCALRCLTVGLATPLSCDVINQVTPDWRSALRMGGDATHWSVCARKVEVYASIADILQRFGGNSA